MANDTQGADTQSGRTVHSTVYAQADVPPGTSKTIQLSAGREIALYNVNGEFYASENLCPHQGAPLAEGTLCEYVVECGLHGWQFDVRTGECLTVPEKIETYEVLIEDGLIRVIL